MNFPVFALAFCGFLGGLLVISRTLRWVVGLREALRPQVPADGGKTRRPWLVLAFLHSGPWVLALAILDRDLAIVIVTALCSPLGGWMFAWVMWQWIGTSLEVAEKKRRLRAEREAA